jgi:hypothetical protein
MISRTPLIPLTILLAAAGLHAESDETSFRWSGKLAPGRVLEIKGVNGDIRAEGTTGSDVELTAEKTSRRSDPTGVRIQIVDNGNGMTVCAVYPSSRHGRPNECRPGTAGRMHLSRNDVKVEFTVRVPNGVRFIGRTVNGGVQANHLGADVEAYTLNGKIVVSTAGAALAETVNGSIHVIMGKARWLGARRFSTVNGSIDIQLPGNTGTQLSASTVNGDITTDFPLATRSHIANRNPRATLKNGGRELKISTVNGNIVVREAGGPAV